MLSEQEILSAIAVDKYSRIKRQAKAGQKYYDGRHDILDLDKKDGKYGFNTDPERGADTFVPFN